MGFLSILIFFNRILPLHLFLWRVLSISEFLLQTLRQEKQLSVHMAQDIGKTSFELDPDQDRISGCVTR